MINNAIEPLRNKQTLWYLSTSATHSPSLIGHPCALSRCRILFMRWTMVTLGSDWMDSQADLSLRWAKMPHCWFSTVRPNVFAIQMSLLMIICIFCCCCQLKHYCYNMHFVTSKIHNGLDITSEDIAHNYSPLNECLI